jgi:protein-disulfide isomerase
MTTKTYVWRSVVSPKRITVAVISALLLLFAVGVEAQQKPAKVDEAPFPSYGSGAVRVRLYTDYFCSPCQASEPDLEPVLKDLVTRGVISLTLIDVPIHEESRLYAPYFLYALKKKNTLEHALRVRATLFAAAAQKVATKKEIEGVLKKKGIEFQTCDTSPVFKGFNALMKEDGIKSTPSVVIVNGDKKEASSGGSEILAALKGLK